MMFLSKKIKVIFYIIFKNNSLGDENLDNIVLVFPYKIRNIDEFNKILTDFDEKGYYVYLFNDINDKEFKIDSLFDTINFYKAQHNNNVNKIIIMSNVKEILFSWYRCYNSLADDFVYFLDDGIRNFYKNYDELYSFINNLSDFNGIENESIEGKIFVNINFDNYTYLWNQLMIKNNFRYFDELKNIDSSMKVTKSYYYTKKIYLYENNEYCFEYLDKNSGIEYISVDKESTKSNININAEFTNLIAQNIYFLPYFVINLYKVHTREVNGFLVGLFKRLSNVNETTKQNIYTQFENYMKNREVDFFQKMYILSLMVCFYPEKNTLLKAFVELILKDNDYFSYHYEILLIQLFYINSDKLKIYDGYYIDKKTELDRISNYLIDSMNIKVEGGSGKNKRIAVLVDYLLGLKHSPTKVVLDHIINLKKYYSEYEIEIFVEDNAYMKEINDLIPNFYTSPMSESLVETHREYLKDFDIKINYPNMSKNKDEIIKDTIITIDRYNPDVIFSISDMSISSRILFDFYPIVYLSMGGNYLVNKADVYLCGNRDEILNSNKKYNLLNDDKIMQFNYGLDFEKSHKIKTRESINLNDDDFVMITVGNRLDAEFDKEFLESICNYLESNKNTKWVIVGQCEIKLIKEKYSDLLSAKIIKIPYESDLMSLYDVCDIYLNPRRIGGGISIAMAMEQRLPIVIFSNPSDGVIYVGKENTCGYTVDEYIHEIEKLNTNKEYKAEKSNLMKKIISKFNFETSINMLNEAFLIASKRFINRIK